MCSLISSLLYCVSTAVYCIFDSIALHNEKSIIRYFPPNGTDGLARWSVNGLKRLPTPPAKIRHITLLISQIFPMTTSPLVCRLSNIVKEQSTHYKRYLQYRQGFLNQSLHIPSFSWRALSCA